MSNLTCVVDALYVLRISPFQEKKSLVDCFTKEYGWFRAVYRNQSSSRSRHASPTYLRPELFTCYQADLKLNHSGLMRLSYLEFNSQAYDQMPASVNFCSAVYLNELLMKMMSQRQKVQPLFELYQVLLPEVLSSDALYLAAYLRQFEFALLKLMGVVIDWHTDGLSQSRIQEQSYYYHLSECGVVSTEDAKLLMDEINIPENLPYFAGKALLQLPSGEGMSDIKAVLAQGQLLKQLHRLLIDRALQGKTLKSRKMLNELVQFQQYVR